MRTVGRAIIFAAPALYKGCDAPAWPASSPFRSSYPRPTRRLPAPPAPAAPSPTPAEPAPPVVVPAAAPALPGTFADVGMQLNVRFELKADQFRNLHCSAIDLQQALSGCSAGFPTISPNPQYSI